MVATGQTGNNEEATPTSVRAALERVAMQLEIADLYFGHGTDNAWDEGVQLVLHVLALDPHSGAEVLELPLTPAQWAAISTLLAERVDSRKPLPYLTGRGWFAGLEFECDERALVPRSPLAELIADDYAPWWQGPATARILDLCCGGGSIGIAAAVYRAQADVVLADIDGDALALAARNVARHEVGDRVSVQRSDLFSAIDAAPFDLILCNPPYVDAADMRDVPLEFRHEPEHALAAGTDGLDLALEILAQAPAWLNAGGHLFLELGNSWEALDALCSALPLAWVEFGAGGHGVLSISREDLLAGHEHFAGLAAARRSEGV